MENFDKVAESVALTNERMREMEATTEKPIPKQAEGMRRVTSKEFFEWIGKKDVHPRILTRWSDSVGYVCEWRWQDASQTLVGVSDGGNGVLPGLPGASRYWLKQKEQDKCDNTKANS